MQRTLFKVAFLIFVMVGNTTNATSFEKAKELLKEVYSGHNETFYCGCDYIQKDPDLASCGLTPRKNPNRADRIEIEHVVPAAELGGMRACWSSGGRSECNKTDEFFVQMTSDLHNLVPAIGEVNGDRSNFKFGLIPGEERSYGACNFEIDFKHDIAEPSEDVMGNIARTYFYMRDRYGLRIEYDQLEMFNHWILIDPVDEWELERDKRIGQIQGNRNCYVSKERECKIDRVKDPEIATKGHLDRKLFNKPASLSTTNRSRFSCDDGKTYCKSLSSCEEAVFKLNECGLTRLDRDGDGVPCENLCR